MKRLAITDWFADLIDHEAYADGPPPQKLWPFDTVGSDAARGAPFRLWLGRMLSIDHGGPGRFQTGSEPR